jgi:homoserine kinase
VARVEIPLSEVLPAPAGGVDTGAKPPEPPHGIGHHIKFRWAPEIKAVAIIPDFEVPTHQARAVLPAEYPRSDVVSLPCSSLWLDLRSLRQWLWWQTFNLQRIALLPVALGQSPPDPELIYLAMQDKLHQSYRQTLIPGLTEIVESMTPSSQPGLLGVCLSGAGPTILALATGHYEEIADRIIARFKRQGIDCSWMLLEPAEGSQVIRQ